MLKSSIVPTWCSLADRLITQQPAERRSDLREIFEHRAAVCEYDGGEDRSEAERLAFLELRKAIEHEQARAAQLV